LCEAVVAAARIASVTPGTADAAPPPARAARSAGTESAERPAETAAAPTVASYDASLLLMIASRMALPKAPPIARALKARPVAVD
jgi:hypothetical protein